MKKKITVSFFVFVFLTLAFFTDKSPKFKVITKDTQNLQKKPIDIKEYRQAFQFFDCNNDGLITVAELENAMKKCGVNPTKLEIRVFMFQADKDRNGVLTFDEFVQAMSYQERHAAQFSRPRIDEAELRKQFRLFDKNDDGFIELNEMKAIVKKLSLAKDFPTELVNKVFSEADVNGDGRISFDEFCVAVM